ncbi:MAG: transcriptional regulator [Aristaeellaceae bacterium]
MKCIQDEMATLQQVIHLIANQFGSNCEVVLHDLKQDYAHTIVDIVNGHITNRTVGDCGSNLGLEVLRGTVTDGDRFNYVTSTPDGKILKSSSIYLKDDEGNVIGSICINFDITQTIQMEGFLRQFNKYDVGPSPEVFPQDISSLLNHLINEASLLVGKKPEAMNKNERITFLAYLDAKGAFLITHSSEKVCKLLGISKYTFYSYLETIRAEQDRAE